MSDNKILSDINEAAQLLEAYNLECLVWIFEECPLKELQHYREKGNEELAVVCRKGDSYLPHRLVFNDGSDPYMDSSKYYTTLSFHPEFDLHIVTNPSADE